ncbi:hypothetical protein CM19_00200 [Candidatus Acidianus copahuensis]|uniref:Nuclease n=1 Tax=Candidatus Acidianus copahuensis TaxID=1160895 RepID=A0A031LUK8_9CREN|nr:hypothetical protein [Candidatus Acidianus copahuensis]EZQ12057.1 hypothetical protein CM19_00200 [Candidatus Acidianus copahuensis]
MYLNQTLLKNSFFPFEGVREEIRKIIFEKRKEIGYTKWTWVKKEFGTWLDRECESPSHPLIKLYCKKYEKSLDGIIEMLRDAKSQNVKIALLIDEAREDDLARYFHKLINSGVATMVIAFPTSEIGKVSDKALARRIKENLTEIEQPNKRDVEEILEHMCGPEIGKEISQDVFYPDMTIAELVQTAREFYFNVQKICEENKECFLSHLKNMENLQERSKDLENLIRGIIRDFIKDRMDFILFDTQKKINVGAKDRLMDIVLIYKDKLYLGDVKLTNQEMLSQKNYENVSDVVSYIDNGGNGRVKIDKKEYIVEKVFLITNAKKIENDHKITVFQIPLHEFREALEFHKTDKVRERIRNILVSLKLI